MLRRAIRAEAMSEHLTGDEDRRERRRRDALSAFGSLLLHALMAATLFTISIAPSAQQPEANASTSTVLIVERQVAAVQANPRPQPPRPKILPRPPQPPRPPQQPRLLSVTRPKASPQPPPQPIRTPRPSPAPPQAAPTARPSAAPLVARVAPHPSPKPTLAPRPSPQPTQTPRPIPSPQPTHVPSPAPSTAPSPAPTHVPSPAPHPVPSPMPHPVRSVATPGPKRSAAPGPKAPVAHAVAAPPRPVAVAPTPKPRPKGRPNPYQQHLNALIPHVRSTPSGMTRVRTVYHLGNNLGPTPPSSVIAATKFLYRHNGSDGQIEMWVTGISHRGPFTICHGWLVRVPPPRYATPPGPIGGLFASGTRPFLNPMRGGERPIVQANVSYTCDPKLLEPFTPPSP